MLFFLNHRPCSFIWPYRTPLNKSKKGGLWLCDKGKSRSVRLEHSWSEEIPHICLPRTGCRFSMYEPFSINFRGRTEKLWLGGFAASSHSSRWKTVLDLSLYQFSIINVPPIPARTDKLFVGLLWLKLLYSKFISRLTQRTSVSNDHYLFAFHTV